MTKRLFNIPEGEQQVRARRGKRENSLTNAVSYVCGVWSPWLFMKKVEWEGGGVYAGHSAELLVASVGGIGCQRW